MGRIPRPFPDKEKLKYKLKCFESPATALDGTAQPVNYFMLRAQIKKKNFFNEGKLNKVKEITDVSILCGFWGASSNIPKLFKMSPFLQRLAKSNNNRPEATKPRPNYWEELLPSGGLKSLSLNLLTLQLLEKTLPSTHWEKIEKWKELANYHSPTRCKGTCFMKMKSHYF